MGESDVTVIHDANMHVQQLVVDLNFSMAHVHSTTDSHVHSKNIHLYLYIVFECISN